MITYHKIQSANKEELRQIAIQTAELNQKMYAMLEECSIMLRTGTQENAEECAQRVEILLAEARGEG